MNPDLLYLVSPNEGKVPAVKSSYGLWLGLNSDQKVSYWWFRDWPICCCCWWSGCKSLANLFLLILSASVWGCWSPPIFFLLGYCCYVMYTLLPSFLWLESRVNDGAPNRLPSNRTASSLASSSKPLCDPSVNIRPVALAWTSASICGSSTSMNACSLSSSADSAS